jgi:hypothetical protein
MSIVDRDIKIKKNNPSLILQSGRNFTASLGVGPRQLTVGEIACSNLKTVKVLIGGLGVTGCNFNFVTAANTTEQRIDLGSIIPALARVMDVKIHTEVGFHSNTTTLVATVGNQSAGHEFVGSATIMAINAINAMVQDHFLAVAPAAAASKVWVNATPGANWSNATLGRIAVYITYLEI